MPAWDRNDETRAWSKRFFDKQGRMPIMAQASAYSAVRHYIKAIAAAGTDEAKAVMAKMREIPVNDFYAHNGHLREDGRLVHDMDFAQVKTPPNPPSRGIITRSSAPFPAIRRSARCPKAAARWWRSIDRGLMVRRREAASRTMSCSERPSFETWPRGRS